MAEYDIIGFMLPNGDVCITTDAELREVVSDLQEDISDLQEDISDLQDQVHSTQSDIAIIIEGNKTTHTGGVAVNGFVSVRNSTISGITDGLYTAVKAIPANTAIDSTYLTAVDGGGLNAVNSIIGDIIKYKDYIKTDTYGANEFGQVADLDSNGITGYTPISVVKISPIPTGDANKRLVPYIYNYNNATRLMVHNISGAAITTGLEYVYRVYFIKTSLITLG